MKCENCNKKIGIFSSGEKIHSNSGDFTLCTECGKLLYNMRYDAKNNLDEEFKKDREEFVKRNKGKRKLLKDWFENFEKGLKQNSGTDEQKDEPVPEKQSE